MNYWRRIRIEFILLNSKSSYDLFQSIVLFWKIVVNKMNKQMNIFVDQIPNNKNFYDTKKKMVQVIERNKTFIYFIQ